MQELARCRLKIIYRIRVEDREISLDFQKSISDERGAIGFHPQDHIGRSLLDAIQSELPQQLQGILDVGVNVQVLSARYGSWEIVFAVIAAISAYHDLNESLELMRDQISALLDQVLRRNGHTARNYVSRGYVVGTRETRRRIPQSLSVTPLLQMATIVLLVYVLIFSGRRSENPPVTVSIRPIPSSFECTPKYAEPSPAEPNRSTAKGSEKVH